jgi:hypothetical protein
MIERVEGTQAGVIELRASGKLSREDYTEVLEPALREGVDSGELRLVFVLPDFDGLEHGAWAEDMKTGLRTWVRDHAAWRRFALVTDIEWIAKSMRAFAWMAPGEVKVFELDDLDDAREWVAA